MITFAEILKDKGYPGFDPVKHIDAPWVSDQLSLFRPEDEARFWFKGFQWPRAYPLNFVWLEDGFAWGTQSAAHNMPLPPSDGLAPRVAGIFVYGSDIPVSPWVAGNRGERVGSVLPPFLQNFPAIWNERRDEIVKGLRYDTFNRDRQILRCVIRRNNNVDCRHSLQSPAKANFLLL